MPILTWIGWTAIGLAALVAFVGLADADVFFIAPAISTGIAGVLMLAIERVIRLLTDIRDAFCGGAAENVEKADAGLPQADDQTGTAGEPYDRQKATRDLEEKLANIKRAR